MAPLLLGPPEIHLSPSLAVANNKSTGDDFMDLLIANFNTTSLSGKPPMGLTENQSPTYLATGNPCLDFFFHVVPDTPSERATYLLDSAWRQDSLTALKLVCNLRGVRGTGKSDKEGFYSTALWLHKNHPKTLACNVRSFSEFGYLKDLPEILYRLLEGLEVRKIAKEQRGGVKRKRRRFSKKPWSKRKQISRVFENTREERVATEAARVKLKKDKARSQRKMKIAAMAKKAVERYNLDPDYRLLHDRISELFAELLGSDLESIKSGKTNHLSLAAKWCPSLDSSYDKSTLLCESIAKRLFPREKYPEYAEIEEQHYAYRVRDRLRKEVLVPIRKILQLPEVYMSANQWSVLPYNRVASVAMKTYKKLFRKHDPQRFSDFLGRVREGKAKIAAGALLPHEIILACEGDDAEVAELQWRRMVEDLLKKGKLSNCLAVCDVSGSMSGTPLQVCVALGLLTSELCEDPWKGNVITFSQDPRLNTIEGESLREKTQFMNSMDWGMNTDFQKVFDLILQVAILWNLEKEKMIKRVLVFSDMEFDQASANPWETDYSAIQRKFREAGFESPPEIVFWNLRDSRATPVPSGQNGVALVSGFSKNLLTLFLEGGGVPNPVAVMEAAISGDEYRKLVVFD